MRNRIAQVGDAAIDARRIARTRDAGELAGAAGWIAGDFLAALGVRVSIEGDVPAEPGLIAIRATDLAGFVAAVSAIPALIDGDTLPVRWRLALRLLGMPLRSVQAQLDGVPVAVLAEPGSPLASAASCTATVGADALGYQVRVAPQGRACLPAA